MVLSYEEIVTERGHFGWSDLRRLLVGSAIWVNTQCVEADGHLEAGRRGRCQHEQSAIHMGVRILSIKCNTT